MIFPEEIWLLIIKIVKTPKLSSLNNYFYQLTHGLDQYLYETIKLNDKFLHYLRAYNSLISLNYELNPTLLRVDYIKDLTTNSKTSSLDLVHLTNLTKLDLLGCLNEFDLDFNKLTKLTHLNVQDTWVNLEGAYNLIELRINHPEVKYYMSEFNTLTNLKTLDLGDGLYEDYEFELPQLEELSLHDQLINLEPFTNLTKLSISHNYDVNGKFLKDLTKLKTLTIDNCYGFKLKHLKSAHIDTLNLRYTRIDKQDLFSLTHITNLNIL